MNAGASTSSAALVRIIDLDKVEHLVHPLWEIFDPTPNLVDLFKRFSYLFFDNELKYVDNEKAIELEFPYPVTIKYCQYSTMGESAGISSFRRTYGKNSNKEGPFRIKLNIRLLEICSRKELIEIILHEMIHIYLMATNNEDKQKDNDFHGTKFEKKMKAINRLARTDINSTHYFYEKNWTDGDEKTKKNSGKKKEQEVRSRVQRLLYAWRCENCKNQTPYFGYVFSRKQKRPKELKWLDNNCVHYFNSPNYVLNGKKALLDIDCFEMMAECAMESNYEFKSKYIDFKTISRNYDGYNTTLNGEHMNVTIGASFSEPNGESIQDGYFVNYDPETRKLLKVNAFNSKFEQGDIVCIHCKESIEKSEKNIKSHLLSCIGLKFNFKQSLPLYKIV